MKMDLCVVSVTAAILGLIILTVIDDYRIDLLTARVVELEKGK